MPCSLLCWYWWSAQLHDVVGSVMMYVKDNDLDDNTIIAFSTDNGAENFT